MDALHPPSAAPQVRMVRFSGETNIIAINAMQSRSPLESGVKYVTVETYSSHGGALIHNLCFISLSLVRTF